MTTLAFDVYGTLIDTAGVTTTLDQFIGARATEFSNLWRLKQLEYTWRYGLMGEYPNFRVCTSQALDFCCDQLECPLSDENKQVLMEKYLDLPMFDDVLEGLKSLKNKGLKMYAFSNGVPEDLEILLKNAGALPYLDGIVSVDPDKTFKPNPKVYQSFVTQSGEPTEQCWLVSSNGFDVCGAVAFGMKALWLQRNPAVKFDHWQYRPTKVVSKFEEIIDSFT